MGRAKSATSRTYTFPIEPRTKQAVRFSKRGRAYQPKAIVDFENAIKEHCEALLEQGEPQATGPIKIKLKLYKDKFRVTITDLAPVKSTVRGDVDNYAKAILDGLQGDKGLIANDRQVMMLTIDKQGDPK